MVYQTGNCRRPKAVIDIDDGDAVCAAVQHPEQRGDATKTGAIPDAGRYRNHRYADKPGDNARQGAFHARDDDDHARALEATVFALRALEPETVGLTALLGTFDQMQQRQLQQIESRRLELPAAHTGRCRKRQRPRDSRAIPRALLESYESLVVAYAESCVDAGAPSCRSLLCCAALRPATGESFFRVIRQPTVGAAQLEHLGLEPDAFDSALEPEQFRAEWSAYLRPGAVLASWNASTLRLSSRALGEPRGGISLKGAYYNLRRFRGSLEHILSEEGLSCPSSSRVRAVERLSRALQLAELLRRHASA